MKRRTLIKGLLAAGAAALFRNQTANAAPPVGAVQVTGRLTVKEWAEKYRVVEWTPLEVSYIPQPIFPSIVETKIEIDNDANSAGVYMRFDESEPWTYLGPTERVTVTTKTTRRSPARLSGRRVRFAARDEPDRFNDRDLIDRYARIIYRDEPGADRSI